MLDNVTFSPCGIFTLTIISISESYTRNYKYLDEQEPMDKSCDRSDLNIHETHQNSEVIDRANTRDAVASKILIILQSDFTPALIITGGSLCNLQIHHN